MIALKSHVKTDKYSKNQDANYNGTQLYNTMYM